MKITRKPCNGPKFENVEVAEVTVADMIQAERVVGKAEGVEYMAALVSQVATFDGRKLPAEEVATLKGADFFAVLKETGLEELAESLKESSASVEKEGSPLKK